MYPRWPRTLPGCLGLGNSGRKGSCWAHQAARPQRACNDGALSVPARTILSATPTQRIGSSRTSWIGWCHEVSFSISFSYSIFHCGNSGTVVETTFQGLLLNRFEQGVQTDPNWPARLRMMELLVIKQMLKSFRNNLGQFGSALQRDHVHFGGALSAPGPRRRSPKDDQEPAGINRDADCSFRRHVKD